MRATRFCGFVNSPLQISLLIVTSLKPRVQPRQFRMPTRSSQRVPRRARSICPMEFKVKDYYSNPGYSLMLDKSASAYIRSQSVIAHANQVAVDRVREQELVRRVSREDYLARSPILREYLGSTVKKQLTKTTHSI